MREVYMEEVRILDITGENCDDYAQCGYKNEKHPGYAAKKQWLCRRFDEGLSHKVLVNEKGDAVGGIEYLPGEHAWRPVEAAGYLFIHCIYIMKKDYKAAGHGTRLLEACIEDAVKRGSHGVAALVRQGTWMAGDELFLKKGFSVVETAPPDYSLVVKKLRKTAPDPAIVQRDDSFFKKYNKGLYIFTSGQCPYLGTCVPDIAAEAEKEFGLKPKIIEMTSAEEARRNPALYGTFGIVYNGEIVGDHPMSKTKFRNNMKKMLKK